MRFKQAMMLAAVFGLFVMMEAHLVAIGHVRAAVYGAVSFGLAFYIGSR